MKTIDEKRAEQLLAIRQAVAERRKVYLSLEQNFFSLAGDLDRTTVKSQRDSMAKALESLGMTLSDMDAGLDEEEAEIDDETREILAGINDRNEAKSAKFMADVKEFTDKMTAYVAGGMQGPQPQPPAPVDFEDVPVGLKLTLRKPRGSTNAIKTV